MNPRATVAFLDRAADLGVRGDFEGAYAEYSKAIAIDPGHEQTYLRRGYAAFKKGDIDGAIEDFWKVIELAPQNVTHTTIVAGFAPLPTAICRSRLPTAKPPSAWLRAMRKSGTRAAFSTCGSRAGTTAIADYDAALKIDPTLVAALYGRGLARHRKGDAEAGDADMAAARALDTGIAYEFVRYGMTR